MNTSIRITLTLMSLVIFSLQSLANWQTIEAIGEATKRHESGLVAHKGKVYVIGGRGIKPVEVYDPATNTWTKKAKTPFEMHHITPVSFQDGVLGIFPSKVT